MIQVLRGERDDAVLLRVVVLNAKELLTAKSAKRSHEDREEIPAMQSMNELGTRALTRKTENHRGHRGAQRGASRHADLRSAGQTRRFRPIPRKSRVLGTPASVPARVVQG